MRNMEKDKTRIEATKYDIDSLLNAMMRTVDVNQYATPEIFKAVVEGVIRGYLRGKGSKIASGSVMKIVKSITEYSSKRNDRPTKWWKNWMDRTHSLKKTRGIGPERPGGRIWRSLPKWLRPTTYQVNSDVSLMVTGDGQQVILLRDMNLMGVFDTPQEVRKLTLELMDAVNRLEEEHSVVDIDPIPDTYAETAVTEWEERVRWGITGLDEDNT